MTEKTYSSLDLHKEKVVQHHFVDRLISLQGYVERDTTDFDTSLAVDKEMVLNFVQLTQADEWARFKSHYKSSAVEQFFKLLTKNMKSRSTLDVLRNGIKIVPGFKFSLCFFKPASNLNPDLVELYESNILSLIQELKYSKKNKNRIDVVLFLNGIPVVTLELKNTLTKSTFKNAEKQYRKDRSPAGEPLLTFNRGALVFFALDQDNVSMTTRLMNSNTRFLPFNRGREGGAGNPDIEDEFRIAYLYSDQGDSKAIFSREILLSVIKNFMHAQSEDNESIMIFPRYQQLDVVRKIMRDAYLNGSGQNYLIQHSGGSGKSNTIGWTAHHAINLHNSKDQPIFNSVIIITDRVVLDRQLQNIVSEFEQTKGIVQKIDGTSHQLKEAIEKGARIIVTTVQKFTTDHLKELYGQGSRKFAVIIDEAHSSQSGPRAQALTDALIRREISTDNVEKLIAEFQINRGPQPNISYFAFTATPRNVTLELFGAKNSDGKPYPFHIYSMRQAIEEGFILDVLQNYMTYKAYYQLEKTIAKDPKFKSRQGQRKVARFATLHPTAIEQRVEVIIEHFRRHVMHEIDHKAKAMIVSQSREHALRYYFGVKKYLENKDYADIKVIVAFSGTVEINGQTYKESDLNRFSETELPKQFAGDDYQILIVAEKYQTGFDQPKLCAMYVDRKLSGLQSVQTLSRLNRTMAHKNRTFVLDFQNTIEDIQDAFRPFYEVTGLEENSDPNQIYILESRIKGFGFIDFNNVQEFAEIYYKGSLKSEDRMNLERLVRFALARFEKEENEEDKEEFRQLINSYTRFYGFVAQVVQLKDTELEKLYSYLSWLGRLLPNRDVPPEIEITNDMLKLRAFRVELTEQKDASLSPGETKLLKPIDVNVKPYTQDEERSLSDIVKAFNDRHGTNFTESDMLRFESVNQEILDDKMKEMLKNNPADVVYNAFKKAFFQGTIRQSKRDAEMNNIFLNDNVAREKATKHFFKRALRELEVA